MKLPEDAFEYYVSLGSKRSYRAVAEHFGVEKRTITARAVREKWQDRLARIQERAREKVEDRMADTIAEMHERHLRVLQVILGRGLETLQSMPLTSAWEAIKALDLAMRREAEIRSQARSDSAQEDS
ncbi:MAG: hypothetical protein CMJ94_07495 [Planctomycetes bacterium]|nr:hypothetical protein [Planctomycetota bacterium]